MSLSTAEVFFALTLGATFLAAYLGRIHGRRQDEGGLSNQRLNRWLIGLSAGATANTGFIVTAAVGIGYTGGLHWVLLPLAWLLGDIVFWALFPQRINATGRRLSATTITELLTKDFSDRTGVALRIITSLIVIVSLSTYLCAQWLAGQKFLAGAFEIPHAVALLIFSLLIISYTAIGGFRGSVYADSMQAIIRLIATVLILAVVGYYALLERGQFDQSLIAAGPDFLGFLPPTAAGFVLGYAFAGLGFDLGQPQVVSRYLAGSSPSETQGAWWVYILFVQFTWIGMTIFGVLLRGLMPGLPDPESGLSTFFHMHTTGLILGVIVADIFATIAAASNSILVSISQAIVHDLLPQTVQHNVRRAMLFVAILIVGGATMGVSLLVSGQHVVLDTVLSAVSLTGAAFAAPVMVKILGWRCTAQSLLISLIAGLAAAIGWKLSGLNSILNEAAPGIAMGLLAYAAAEFHPMRNST